MNLRINVNNNTATYLTRDGDIVNNNSNYVAVFSFDSSWDGVTDKVARFVWNGEYFDVPIDAENKAPVPALDGAEYCLVGVYSETMRTTTDARIECRQSILDRSKRANPGHGQHYTEEAKAAAQEAVAAAEAASKSAAEAAESASQAGGGGGSDPGLAARVTRTAKRTTNLEHCIVSDAKVTYSYAADTHNVPEGVAPYAEIKMVGGMTFRDESSQTLFNMKVLSVDSYDKDANSVGYIVIPAAVQALDGYGSGIDDEHCNRIEWDEEGNCRFVTAVVRKTFVGDYREGWTYSPLGSNDVGDNQFCRCKIGDLGLAIDEAIVSNRFDQAYIGSSTTDVGVNITNSSAYGNCGVYIRIPGMTSVLDYRAQLQAWAAEGNPLTVEYAVAVPIYENIGDLITVDNYIKVVEGGHIRFYAENTESVPNEVVFTRKGSTVDVSEVGA